MKFMFAGLFGRLVMTRHGERSSEKEAFWKLAVDEWWAAGTSIRKFCRSNGLTETAFYFWFWRRELAKRAGLPVAEPEGRRTRKSRRNSDNSLASESLTAMFLPLTLRPHETAAVEGAEPGSIEIVVGDHRLGVPPGFDEVTLSRLLAGLGRLAGRMPTSRA